MDYKKKYEEALEYMHTIYPTLKGADKEDIEHYFPELKESKDEEIRKHLISFLKDIMDFGKDTDFNKYYKSDCAGWIAWLEKQCEQETLCDKCRKEQPSHSCQDITALGRCAVEHEQKSTDNIEPKFKVGDWIVNSEGKLRHIVSVDNTGYQTDNGWLSHEFYEKTYHLWTIQDAKDGDVLAVEPIYEYTSSFIAIYKECDLNSFTSYCFIDFNGMFNKGTRGHSINLIHLATKEQRNLLFQKMKEAGYGWDSEKKELKRINESI